MKLILDFQKCTGCKLCQLACSAKHQGIFNPKKAHLRVIDHYTKTGRVTELKSCTLCLKCADTCPVEAITLKGQWLTIDDGLCTGCGDCVDVCPEGIIFLNDQNTAAIPNFCEGNPFCVEWCPHGAIRIEEAAA
jgi:anaerobic carbon-monoxide dehydrogenase iron sulfur subunit